MNVVDINMMLVASDNENATIQNTHSVVSSLRKLGKLSVPVWIQNDHNNENFKIIIFTTNASKLCFQKLHLKDSVSLVYHHTDIFR